MNKLGNIYCWLYSDDIKRQETVKTRLLNQVSVLLNGMALSKIEHPIQFRLKAELRKRGILPNFDMGVNPAEEERQLYMAFMNTSYVYFLFDEYKKHLCKNDFPKSVAIFLKARDKIS